MPKCGAYLRLKDPVALAEDFSAARAWRTGASPIATATAPAAKPWPIKALRSIGHTPLGKH